MIRKIGLTGGIGSGKSTVAGLFRQFSLLVYEADLHARQLTQESPEVIAQIENTFGENIYRNGILQKAILAKIVFNDKDKLDKLNAIVHPAVRDHFLQWIDHIPENYEHNFILQEAAILFETGGWKLMDGMITVFAPEELRIERVCARDGVTKEGVLLRMKNQAPESFKLEHADFVIHNDGSQLLIPQVKAAIDFFSKSKDQTN